MTAKTQQEIDELKRQWLRDPCWDIELTEGFQDHIEELKAFADKQAILWQEQRELREKAENDRLSEKAAALGIPGNLSLTRHIQQLENKIYDLQNRLNTMEGD